MIDRGEQHPRDRNEYGRRERRPGGYGQHAGYEEPRETGYGRAMRYGGGADPSFAGEGGRYSENINDWTEPNPSSSPHTTRAGRGDFEERYRDEGGRGYTGQPSRYPTGEPAGAGGPGGGYGYAQQAYSPGREYGRSYYESPGTYGGFIEQRGGHGRNPYQTAGQGRGPDRPEYFGAGYGGAGMSGAYSGYRYERPGFETSGGSGQRGQPGWRGAGSARSGERREGPKGYVRSDERIRDDVVDRVLTETDVDLREIEIDVEDGVVKLRGEVDDRWEKNHIEEVADRVFGVKDVENHIRKRSPQARREREGSAERDATDLSERRREREEARTGA